MERETSGLESIKRQLMSLNRPKKPKMLVVDDEPDNLDLLYRTFRRNFNVFKAESGIRALEVLEAEGEVAVIISDQRMPEMKGTEFLSKTVPQFPNTVRIILTGFTDIEDLVDAINSGQVYKYITKPWDPNELKSVVQRAAETYELLQQRTAELQRAQSQTHLLGIIMQLAQDCSTSEACLDPIAQAFAQSLEADICIIQRVEENTLAATAGIYSSTDRTESGLSDDPLVKEAISTQTVQACIDISKEQALAEVPHYQTSGIQAHVSVPIVHRAQVIAVVSIQWKKPAQFEPDDLDTVTLMAQAVGLVLSSFS